MEELQDRVSALQSVLFVGNSSEHRANVRKIVGLLGKNLKWSSEQEDLNNVLNTIRQYKPALVIIDMDVHEGRGLEFTRQLRNHVPDLRILIISPLDELLYAERALRAGAHGYLRFDEDPGIMIKAMKKIMDGFYYVSDKVENRILHNIAGHNEIDEDMPNRRLSNRELEIFIKIGEGMSSRKIANELSLSIKTIETHRAHIKRKLNISGSRELASHARDWVNMKAVKSV